MLFPTRCFMARVKIFGKSDRPSNLVSNSKKHLLITVSQLRMPCFWTVSSSGKAEICRAHTNKTLWTLPASPNTANQEPMSARSIVKSGLNKYRWSAPWTKKLPQPSSPTKERGYRLCRSGNLICTKLPYRLTGQVQVGVEAVLITLKTILKGCRLRHCHR